MSALLFQDKKYYPFATNTGIIQVPENLRPARPADLFSGDGRIFCNRDYYLCFPWSYKSKWFKWETHYAQTFMEFDTLFRAKVIFIEI